LNSLGKGELFELEIQRYGGTYDWNSEGMWEGISRFKRGQTFFGTYKLTTLLITMESKVKDKH